MGKMISEKHNTLPSRFFLERDGTLPSSMRKLRISIVFRDQQGLSNRNALALFCDFLGFPLYLMYL